MEEALERIIQLAVVGVPAVPIAPAPTPEKERVVYLANECMYHPPVGSFGSPAQAYLEADHMADVCDALQAAENQDWSACIGELEHLGNTGDTALTTVVEAAAMSLAVYKQLQVIPWEVIQALIERHFPPLPIARPRPRYKGTKRKRK